MFVKMNATRHTKIGTLRAGVIYSGEQLGEAGRVVIEALLAQENPALVKLNKKQAAAHKAAVASLVPKGGEDAQEPTTEPTTDPAAMSTTDPAAAADKAAAK